MTEQQTLTKKINVKEKNMSDLYGVNEKTCEQMYGSEFCQNVRRYISPNFTVDNIYIKQKKEEALLGGTTQNEDEERICI